MGGLLHISVCVTCCICVARVVLFVLWVCRGSDIFSPRAPFYWISCFDHINLLQVFVSGLVCIWVWVMVWRVGVHSWVAQDSNHGQNMTYF